MNSKLIATTIAIAMLSGLAFAQTDPAHETSDHRAASPEAQHQVHQHMDKMQATMKSIHAEEDAAVRKQLMHEHMQQMRAMMKMMGGMQGDGMMGDHMMGGHVQGEGMQHEGAMLMCEDDTAQCQHMNAMAECQAHMAQKMGMMQMMMQQMMEHGAAQEEMDSHEHE